MLTNSIELYIFAGLITGPALKRFSPRQVAIVGSILTGTGLFLSSMSTSLWQLTVSYGFFVGLGLGFINPSSFIAVNSYFSKNRGRAVGLALAGTGVGQMIMPNVVHLLLEKYGFKGTTLVLSALALNGVVGASLFQPVEWHMKRFDEDHFNEKRMLLQPCKHKNMDADEKICTYKLADVSDDDEFYDNRSDIDKVHIIKKSSWTSRVSKALDLQLLKDKIFISIIIGLALAYTASINFSMIFPDFLQVSSSTSTSMRIFLILIFVFTANGRLVTK